jgi:uncharacterized NAD(P)/FAD-binding protein YdhS
MNEKLTIAVIGGGFCGVMTVVNLIEKAKSPVKIFLFNDGYTLAKGVAFGAQSSKYLLNIPAGNMSAFESKPNDFVEWLCQKPKYALLDKELLCKIFVPRKEYGEYLESIWQQALQQKNKNVEIQIIADKAKDIVIENHEAVITFNEVNKVVANAVVLATGNEKPANISIENIDFYNSKLYFKNPWLPEAVQNLDGVKDVFIIGNGLTMIDTVIGLLENNFSGNIYSMSPNGFALLPHGHTGKLYTALTDELQEPYQLDELFKLFSKHIKFIKEFGFSAEPVIDSFRAKTQHVWSALTIHDKKRFLRHLSRHWNAVRHRIPTHIYRLVQNLRIDKKLTTIKGRLMDIKEKDGLAEVIFFNKEDKKKEVLTVQRIINCTGPSANIYKTENDLLKKLIDKRFIKADELKLGIDANFNGQIVDENNKPSTIFYTLGSSMKGVLWESTSVPDLRVQADNLASLLLNEEPQRRLPRKLKA